MTAIVRPGGAIDRLVRRWLPAIKFALVGASGIVVNTLALAAAVSGLGIHYLIGAALATQVSTAWNFVWTDRWVFGERRRRRALTRFATFWSVNNISLLARWPILWVTIDLLGIHYLVANLISLAVIFIGRYAISSGWIWPHHERSGSLQLYDSLPPGMQGPVDPWEPASAGADIPVDGESVRKTGWSWKWGLVLLLVFAAAAFLRLYAIGDVGFNSDESVYAGQGAAMFGEDLDRYFSLFRAHPLLLQMMLGGLFQVFGISDVVARVFVATLFGVGAVVLTYLIAAQSYSRRVAIMAAGLLATMPYHVVVTRQVLVDVPMAFFILLAVYFLKRAVDSGRQEWFLAAAAAASLATLAKEVAVLFVLAALLYLTWSRSWRWVRLRTIGGAAIVYLLGIAPFVASRTLFSAGSGSGNGLATFFWQFGRSPNHTPDYFGRILLQFWGIGLVALALWGLVMMARRRSNGDILLLSVFIVFFGFFQAWPTKLFFYLVVVAPLLAIAAAHGIEQLASLVAGIGRRVWKRLRRFEVATAALLAAAIVSGMVAWGSISPAVAQIPGTGDFDIEVQSFSGGREAGLWIRDNTPPESRLLSIGPSIGNIVRFYGHRNSVALSVSPDPAKRNPAYVPVANPDLALRSLDVHYVIWDAYSADRSVFYDQRLRRYIDKYDGVPVFSVYATDGQIYTVEGPPPAGTESRILVYSVAGGSPLDEGSR